MKDLTFICAIEAKTSKNKTRFGIVYYTENRTDFRQFQDEIKEFLLDRIKDPDEVIISYETWINEPFIYTKTPDYMERLSDFDVEWLKRWIFYKGD